MNTENMEHLIKNLGCSYDALVANNVIDTIALQSLYDDDSLEAVPEPGVELVFWPDTLRFEMLHITLRDDLNNEVPVYTGDLPRPFSNITDSTSAHKILGTPIVSKKPIELHGTGFGGWDTYQVDTHLHPAALLNIQYSLDLKLSRLQFSVMDSNI